LDSPHFAPFASSSLFKLTPREGGLRLSQLKLPTETRLYVPRVLATLAVRTGVAPNALASPGKPTAID